MPATISMEPTYVIEEADQVLRGALIEMLINNSTGRLELPYLFPKFIKVIDEMDRCFDCRFSITPKIISPGEEHRRWIENRSTADEQQTDRRKWRDAVHRRKLIPQHFAANAHIEERYMVGGVGKLQGWGVYEFVCQIAVCRLWTQFGVVHIQRPAVPENVEHFYSRRVSLCSGVCFCGLLNL